MNKKRRSIVILAVGFMLFVLLLVLGIRSSTNQSTIVSAPQFSGPPMANFEGEKSTEFYNSQSDNNYNAARKIVGDFLINQEKIESKVGVESTAIAEIKSFSNEYGPNTQYITNFEFKSKDNGKTYKAQIINYLNNSQSSCIIVIGYNYEKTFGDFTN